MRHYLPALLVTVLLTAVAGCRHLAYSTKVEPASATNGIAYFLPRVYLKLWVTNDAETGTTTALKALEAVPDRDFCYSVRFPHKWHTDDEFTFTVNSAGLLQSVHTKSTDQSLTFVAKLGELAVQVAKGVAALDAGKAPARVQEFVFDPAAANQPGQVNAELRNGGLPFEIEFEGVPGRAAAGPADRAVAPAGQDPAPGKAEKPNQDSIRGIVYRRATLILVRLKHTATGEVLAASPFLLPNFGPEVVLPLVAGPFVTSEYSVTFENGVLISITGKRPSELIGAITPVVELAKSVVSIPGELFKIKVDQSSAEKTLVENQKLILEFQKAINDLKAGRAGSDGQ